MKQKKLEKLSFCDKLDVVGYMVDNEELLFDINNKTIPVNKIKVKNAKVIIGVK